MTNSCSVIPGRNHSGSTSSFNKSMTSTTSIAIIPVKTHCRASTLCFPSVSIHVMMPHAA